MNQNPPSEFHGLSTRGSSRFASREGVVLRHVAGEHMLVPTVSREVDLDSLFLLNATGVFVWERLDGRRTLDDLAGAVEAAFGAPPDAARRDVEAFLAQLAERGLTVPV